MFRVVYWAQPYGARSIIAKFFPSIGWIENKRQRSGAVKLFLFGALSIVLWRKYYFLLSTKAQTWFGYQWFGFPPQP